MKKLLVSLKRSPNNSKKNQLDNLKALGLKRINDEVIHENNEAIKGMCRKVSHLITVEEIDEEAINED